NRNGRRRGPGQLENGDVLFPWWRTVKLAPEKCPAVVEAFARLVTFPPHFKSIFHSTLYGPTKRVGEPTNHVGEKENRVGEKENRVGESQNRVGEGAVRGKVIALQIIFPVLARP